MGAFDTQNNDGGQALSFGACRNYSTSFDAGITAIVGKKIIFPEAERSSGLASSSLIAMDIGCGYRNNSLMLGFHQWMAAKPIWFGKNGGILPGTRLVFALQISGATCPNSMGAAAPAGITNAWGDYLDLSAVKLHSLMSAPLNGNIPARHTVIRNAHGVYCGDTPDNMLLSLKKGERQGTDVVIDFQW